MTKCFALVGGGFIFILPEMIDFEPEDSSVGIFGNCVICGKYAAHDGEYYVIFDDGSVRDHNQHDIGKIKDFTEEQFAELVQLSKN